MVDAGLIVLVVVHLAVPRRAAHGARAGRRRASSSRCYVDTPLAVAEQRDAKGLYKKARRGELKNFTGIDSPYEPPEHPEIHLDTTQATPEQAAAQIVEALQQGGRHQLGAVGCRSGPGRAGRAPGTCSKCSATSKSAVPVGIRDAYAARPDARSGLQPLRSLPVPRCDVAVT